MYSYVYNYIFLAVCIVTLYAHLAMTFPGSTINWDFCDVVFEVFLLQGVSIVKIGLEYLLLLGVLYIMLILEVTGGSLILSYRAHYHCACLKVR